MVTGVDALVNGVLKGSRGIPVEVLACSDNLVAELTNLIEVRVITASWVIREALEGIMVLISRVVVILGRVPWCIRGKKLVGKGLPLMISEGAHLKPRQSIVDDYPTDVVFTLEDLKAFVDGFAGPGIDVQALVFHLYRGMDGSSPSKVGIVVHDTDVGSLVGFNHTTTSSKGQVVDQVSTKSFNRN